MWIEAGVTVRKLSIQVKIANFLSHVAFKFENNRAPPLSNIKLFTSFRRHMWIWTGVPVRKRLKGFMTYVTLTFGLWPWPFAWTLPLSMVITPEIFKVIRWEEHCQKVWQTDRHLRQTDRQTEGRMDWTIHRAAWSQLKTSSMPMHLSPVRVTTTLDQWWLCSQSCCGKKLNL